MLSQKKKKLSEVVNQYFYLFFLFVLKSEIFEIYTKMSVQTVVKKKQKQN